MSYHNHDSTQYRYDARKTYTSRKLSHSDSSIPTPTETNKPPDGNTNPPEYCCIPATFQLSTPSTRRRPSSHEINKHAIPRRNVTFPHSLRMVQRHVNRDLFTSKSSTRVEDDEDVYLRKSTIVGRLAVVRNREIGEVEFGPLSVGAQQLGVVSLEEGQGLRAGPVSVHRHLGQAGGCAGRLRGRGRRGSVRS